MQISALIVLIPVIIGTIIQGKTLLTKSEIEKVFLTTENVIKYYLFSLFSLSSLISILITYSYGCWKFYIKKEEFNWLILTILFIISFIFFLLSLHLLKKYLNKFFIKTHYKYKADLEKVGVIYIIKMLNESTCLCSKEPNAEFIPNYDNYILLKLEELNKQRLIKEKINKPKRSLWYKIMSDT